jgi:hypothetical protein
VYGAALAIGGTNRKPISRRDAESAENKESSSPWPIRLCEKPLILCSVNHSPSRKACATPLLLLEGVGVLNRSGGGGAAAFRVASSYATSDVCPHWCLDAATIGQPDSW